jgi:chorismate mutase/prephenate dehydrogenase
MSAELNELRARLDTLDDEVLAIVERRLEVIAAIARVKRSQGLPVRDVGREDEIRARLRDAARRRGVPSDLAASLIDILLRASLEVQEHDRVVAHGRGAGRRALVVGGAGRMGRWLVRFLASQGFGVTVADPAGSVGDQAHVADWREVREPQDLIVVAAPLGVSAAILNEMAWDPPRGLVFDVGSLKSPLRAALQALAAAGARVTSVHPMFGPSAELLAGRHVIFVDVGVPEATAEARALFAPTLATLVEMSLDEHDRLIAYVLGLSHALNIAFFTALGESGVGAADLERISSTTFNDQLEVSGRVAAENPHLYFEIQHLNPHRLAPLAALRHAVDAVASAVEGGDEAAFVRLMERGRAYLAALAGR